VGFGTMSTVFEALNRFISRLDSDTPTSKSGDGPGGFGFQVLRNKNPEIAVEPWYDFVIGINGRQVVSLPLPTAAVSAAYGTKDDPDPNLFATEVRNCAGANVALTLWNAKVSLAPTSNKPVLR